MILKYEEDGMRVTREIKKDNCFDEIFCLISYMSNKEIDINYFDDIHYPMTYPLSEKHKKYINFLSKICYRTPNYKLGNLFKKIVAYQSYEGKVEKDCISAFNEAFINGNWNSFYMTFTILLPFIDKSIRDKIDKKEVGWENEIEDILDEALTNIVYRMLFKSE